MKELDSKEVELVGGGYWGQEFFEGVSDLIRSWGGGGAVEQRANNGELGVRG